MTNGDNKVRLKIVDEESTDESPRLIRLNKGTVEELDDQPALKIGLKGEPDARPKAATRDELKIRSNNPNMDSLIEREMNPLEEKWETTDTSQKTQKKVPRVWLIALGLMFSAGIVWSLFEVRNSEERSEELKVQAGSFLEKEAEEMMEAKQMVETIESVVREFLESRSVDEMVKHVRHPARVRPLMEDYYSRNAFNSFKVKETVDLTPVTIENIGSLWVIVSKLESMEKRHLLIETDGSDVAKVDWETFVCYQPMEWEKFVSERPSGYTGDFRVYLDRDHFYSYEFSDSKKYASYRLSALNSDELLYGYALREGAVFNEIERLLDSSGGSRNPMILKLHISDDAISKRGVLIEDLVAIRWAFVRSPEVEGR